MGRTRPAAACLLLLAGLLGLAVAQGGQEGQWQSGRIGQLGFGSTYNPTNGACGYGSLPDSAWPFGAVAAINPSASPFAAATVQQGCGLCLEVQCTDTLSCGSSAQPVEVLVTDYCSGCGSDVVNLAPSAFRKAAAGALLGQVEARFRRVPCNPPGNMQVHVDAYRATAGGWLRLALKSVAGSGDIRQVELASSQSPESWRPMQRTHGASWELSTLPQAPLDLRVTDSSGQTVVARRALQQAGQTGDFTTSLQFEDIFPPVSSATPPTTPSPAGPTTFESIFGSPAPQPVLSPPIQAPQPLPAPPPAPEPTQAPTPPPAPEPTRARTPPPATEPSPPPTPPPAPEPSPPSPSVQLVGGAPAAAPAPESVLQPPPPGSPQLPPAASPAFALPQPTPSSPEIVDTRPPRPPGVGPSVTPAPVVFSPVLGLPTLPAQPPAVGPLSGDQLAATAGIDPATCLTLGDVLARIPEAANWTQLLKAQGLEVLLRDKTTRRGVTLLVPVDSALQAVIDARPLRNESTLAELILNAPEIQNPLVGYHLLRGLWPSWTLQPGTRLNTSDTINKVDFLQITAQGPDSLQGIGTSARILQADIAACGPSVVHIIDQVLLPFTFDQAAVDAVSGTTAPRSMPGPTSVAVAPPAAGFLSSLSPTPGSP